LQVQPDRAGDRAFSIALPFGNMGCHPPFSRFRRTAIAVLNSLMGLPLPSWWG